MNLLNDQEPYGDIPVIEHRHSPGRREEDVICEKMDKLFAKYRQPEIAVRRKIRMTIVVTALVAGYVGYLFGGLYPPKAKYIDTPRSERR